MVPMLWVVFYILTPKNLLMQTTKTNFSQRYFSNTAGSSSSLGLKTSTDNWKFMARGSYTILIIKLPMVTE
jgi:iron complex outermembrane receptor protein